MLFVFVVVCCDLQWGGLFGVGGTGHVVVVVVIVMILMILTTMTMMIDTDDMVVAWFDDDAWGPTAMGFDSHS